jgi:hypothetical protein
MENYQATSTVMSLDREYSIKDFEGDDWKPLTEAGRKRYLDLRVGEVQRPADPYRYRIQGTAKIGRRDTINVVYIAGTPFRKASSESAPGFKVRFETIEVTIVAGDDDKRGILRYTKESDFGPEHLSLEFMIHVDKLKAIMVDIARRQTPPILEVSASASFCRRGP